MSIEAGNTVTYFDGDWEEQTGKIIERNGSMVYVEDVGTGQRQWLAAFEVKGKGGVSYPAREHYNELEAA